MDTFYFKNETYSIIRELRRLISELADSNFLDEDAKIFRNKLKEIRTLAEQEISNFNNGVYRFEFDIEKYKLNNQGFSPITISPPEDTPVLLRGYFPSTGYCFDIGTKKGEKFSCVLSGDNIDPNNLSGWRSLKDRN